MQRNRSPLNNIPYTLFCGSIHRSPELSRARAPCTAQYATRLFEPCSGSRAAPAARCRAARDSPGSLSWRLTAQEAGMKLREELAALQQAVNPLFLPAAGSPAPSAAAISAANMISPTDQAGGGPRVDTSAEPSRTYGLA